nr:hypothetical protein CFP56_21110 [Quercus suber]
MYVKDPFYWFGSWGRSMGQRCTNQSLEQKSEALTVCGPWTHSVLGHLISEESFCWNGYRHWPCTLLLLKRFRLYIIVPIREAGQRDAALKT